MLYPGIPVYHRPGCEAERTFQRPFHGMCFCNELRVSPSLFQLRLKLLAILQYEKQS